PPVRHNPFLRMEELPAFLRTLRKYPGRQQTQLGIRLLLLTGVRTGELRRAEPGQFLLDDGLWIIEPENVKQLKAQMIKAGKNPADRCVPAASGDAESPAATRPTPAASALSGPRRWVWTEHRRLAAPFCAGTARAWRIPD